MEEHFYHTFLEKYSNGRMFSSAFRDQLFQAVSQVRFQINDHLPVRGEANRDIFYLYKGSAIGYMEDQGSQEIVRLWQSGDIILNDSILLPRPFLGIIFTGYSETLSIDIEKLRDLEPGYEEARFLKEKLMQHETEELTCQYHQMAHFYPEDRLSVFTKKYAQAFNPLTQPQKASALGVSVSTLKRLK